LIETERLLNESLVENDRLREVENTVSAKIREVESQHKTAEEGLQTTECQLVEISAKLEQERDRSSGFQAEIDKLRAELAEARQVSSNAENAAQAFYDQGFKEAAGSLRLQLRQECNIYFLKGWVSALEQAVVDDSSELYVLGRDYRPFNSGTPKNLEEAYVDVLEDREAVDDLTALETAEALGHQERAQTEEVQDVEKDVSDKEDNVNVDD
jgi:chromosome segregation ATPase